MGHAALRGEYQKQHLQHSLRNELMVVHVEVPLGQTAPHGHLVENLAELEDVDHLMTIPESGRQVDFGTNRENTPESRIALGFGVDKVVLNVAESHRPSLVEVDVAEVQVIVVVALAVQMLQGQQDLLSVLADAAQLEGLRLLLVFGAVGLQGTLVSVQDVLERTLVELGNGHEETVLEGESDEGAEVTVSEE